MTGQQDLLDDRAPIAVTPDGATWSRTLTDGTEIGLRASGLRKGRSGNHGKIEIFDGPVLLSYSVFNIDRDEDRGRIANKAHKNMGRPGAEMKPGIPYLDADLRHDLDLFCREVYDLWVSEQGATLVEGDPDSTVQFLARPHIIEGGGTIMFGLQGGGKSYTAMLLAVAIDAGLNGLWQTRKGNVLYVNLERSGVSMGRRLARVNKTLGLPPTRQIYMMNRRGRGLADIGDALARDVEEMAIDLVVVDSISRTGIGDLNENQATNDAINLLNGLGTSWLGLGHTPRSTQDRVFGSTMWDAGADIMVRLTGARNGSRHGIHLEITKENDLGPQPDLTLAYTFEPERGLASAEKANIADFPELLEAKRQKPAEAIAEFLLAEGPSTATQISEGTGLDRANISRTLKADGQFGEIKRDGRNVIYALMARETE